MPDMTNKEANELQDKLGVKTETVKKAFEEVFSEALPYINNPSLGSETGRLLANALHFGFRVGFLISLRDERLKIPS